MPFSSDPLPVSFAEGAPFHTRVRMFLGHYDLRIYLTEKGYVDVDRGSFDAALMVKYVINDYEGCIGTIGQFCNCATRSEIFGGGEHHNELPVNVVFTVIPPFSLASQDVASLRPKAHTPFRIGNGVVISGHAKVMSGAEIGDGAVLAADALAVGKLEPFTIYGGVPAKPIKQRFDAATQEKVAAVRWWDFDTVYMGNNLHRLQELAIQPDGHVYREAQPRLVLMLKVLGDNITIDIPGFLVGAISRPMKDAPDKVKQYVRQLGSPGPYYWLANMWA